MRKKLILASSDILLEKNFKNICITEDIYSLKKANIKKYDISTIFSHWKKKSKKKKDYLYLKRLYYSVFDNLVNSLNIYHSLNLSKKKWHLILGPWLNYAIPILWDRWETVQTIKKKFGYIKNINVAENHEGYLKSVDFNDFIDKSQCQSWNSEIFKSIIDFDRKWKAIFKKKKIKKQKFKKKQPRTILKFIDKIIQIFEKFFYKKNLLLTLSNFEKQFYFEYFLKSKLIIRPYTEFDISFDKFNRTKIEKKFKFKFKKVKNFNFENYLSETLNKIIPLSYLENFEHYIEEAKKINIKSENIFTAFRHYENDLFKVWVSINNKKLISCIHGGNIEKEFFFNSWQRYSYNYITWNKDKIKKNQINLPVNFLLYRKKRKDRDYLKKKKVIFLLPHAETKPLRLVDGLFCSEVLEGVEKWSNFYKNLDTDIKDNILWRLGPFKDQWNIIEKLENNLGNIQVSNKKSFVEDINNAKVSIHVDLQTTFLETMFMNIPSFILYNGNFWNVSNKGKSIIKKLKEAKILFYNSNDLSRYINKNYFNIESWWESKMVKNARLSFLNYSGVIDQNVARLKWIEYLKNLE